MIRKISDIKVHGYTISDMSPVFIVAEGACNHMCDMSLAKKMIDKAAEAGADAIKFQTYKAEKIVTKSARAFWGDENISQFEYYRRLDRFGKKQYEELFGYATDKGIIAFSSPFDRENADMLADLNMPVFKIASCDIPNLQLIRHIASINRPVILSTGASTSEEIERAIGTVLDQGNNQLALLACTLSYPTKNVDANLLRIKTLKTQYPDFVVGLSDHTEPDSNMIIPSVAVALGARIIEKHYTLDRSMTGSGHFFAVTPEDLRKMVENIRLTETILGNGDLGVSESEKKAWFSARRSIVAQEHIKKGTAIDIEMLAFKRPSRGIPPDKLDELVGRRTIVDIHEDEFIDWDMIE